MSIFFDFDIGPKGRRFRRAVDEDKQDIERFWKKEETETLFCVDDFGSLIELSTLAIVMINDHQTVKGFMALSDHPSLPGIDPASWEVWMRNMFRKYYLSFNTLFIHFICCEESVSDYFLEEALVSVFMNDFYLQHIILVVPPGCKIDCMVQYPAFKRRSIFRHCTKIGEEQEACLCLFVANRNDYCPKLKVRRAVEEDNDDVVELLDKKCKLLKELYGEYYVSEIISRHPNIDRVIIVAESNIKVDDKTSVLGAMCLNSSINYEKLQHTYELSPYHGLVQTEPVAKEEIKRNNNLLQTFGEPIMQGKWSPFENMDKKNLVHGDSSQLKEPKELRRNKSSKVFFSGRRRRRSSIPRRFEGTPGSIESDKASPTVSLLVPDISLMFLIDDEPLDYEIINIESVLMTVPEVDSHSNLDHAGMNVNMSGHRLRKKRSTMTKIEETGLIFQGKPNAFAIELFGMRDDVDDRRAFDLLEAAFECMPQYEYCIIRIPSSKKSFSLLHHFTVVPTKAHMCCEYALYIAHRNSVLGKLRVRKAEISDIPQIAMLLHNLDAKETIWTVENAIQTYPHPHFVYVFQSGYTLVGLAILDPAEHTDLIRSKFIIEAYQYMKYHISGQGLEGGMSMIKTALVYPVFEPHFGFFARDMMRLSGSSTLLWLTAYRNKWVANKANAIVTAMTPLPFRTTATSGIMPELKEVYNMSKNLLSFSAWFVSKKLTSIKKLNVDTRIVVVGASRTAIAFLYNLLFGDSASYLNFTNVTLVSTNGLPYMRHPIQAAELMFPKYQTTSNRFLKSTPFTYYVNVVQATMVEINKQDKCIITEHGSKYYYDKLFLMMGKQYQHPHYMRALSERDRQIRMGKIPAYVRMDDPRFIHSQIEPRVYYDIPENVFLINTISDANRALSYVKTFFWRFDDYKVIVYGSDINAYCCLTALMELEVDSHNIIFVEPFPPEETSKPRVPFFCNNKVDQSVRSILDSLELKVHRGYYFQKWNVDDYNVVQSVEFISHYNVLKLDCAALFFYGKRYIGPHAFVALNKCGLAYDGGILIDHQWRTNDPAIYAAGTATRYYRRYNADGRQQKFYDSYEIGKRLGIQIRNELDPLFSETKKDVKIDQPDLHSDLSRQSSTTPSASCRCSKSTSSDVTCTCDLSSTSSLPSVSLESDYVCYPCLIPKFNNPIVWYCILPGNLQYLEVRPPGAKFPHHYIQSMDYNGTVIETFKTGYFKLHINNDLVVDGVTCLTPDTENIVNFRKLYGHSAVVLNNVHIRFLSGAIPDLYQFFRMPWCVFLYNDQSEDLLTVAKHLKPKHNPDGKTLEEVLHTIGDGLEEAKMHGEDIMQTLRSNFEKNFEAITDNVIEWLTDNDLILPLYVTPSNMIEFSHDISRHPAFKRCRRTIKTMLGGVL